MTEECPLAMDAFGTDYLVHNLPLLILSGLDSRDRSQSDVSTPKQTLLQEGGFRLRTDLPPLDSLTAHALRTSFLSHDGSQALWRAPSLSSGPSRLFKIRAVGRTFTLPPRKAPPPPHSPRLSAIDSSDGPPPLLVLHSPLSPLTPSSPLYPDGIMTPLWITKHQTQLPSALLVFFTLTTDSNTSSLLDNKVKSEINSLRGILSSTNYKTRLVVVLLADGPIQASHVEDRLVNIRKAASLDHKSLYFLSSEASQAEITEFTQSLLSSLHPHCVEYYRDLSKHARRKRNRNATPRPTIPPSNSHPLPSHGWNARYEFKLGVFAEFRQEMDAACRNYESAYESLFVPEMVDSIAAWSPRFNEARLLSDVIAVRILRCLLWTGQTTSAVRTWTSHRDRTRDLINRRGVGTENYGWEAWQSIWSKTMADLLSRSEQPALNSKVAQNPETVSIFAGPEKSLAVGERMAPWENLQHQGYWLDVSQNHLQRRRSLARQIPPEDRQPPGQSPASAIAKNARTYDSYLTLQPHAEFPANGTAGFDYLREAVSTIESATHYFIERGQLRMRELLELKKAREYLQAEAWNDAVLILYPLWKSQIWRQAGWWDFLQRVGWALLDCALKLQDSDLVVRLEWELASSIFASKPNTSYDMHKVLNGYAPSDGRLAIALDVQESASRITSYFAFIAAEGRVGEPLECQFVLQSCAQSGTAPLSLTEAKIVFEGSLKPIYVSANGAESSESQFEAVAVSLGETSKGFNTSKKRSSAGAIASVSGEANLTLIPGQVRIFNLEVTPREAGEISVASITLMLEEDRYSLTVTNSDFEGAYNHWWETKAGAPLRRTIGPSRDVSRVLILPKPPKVEIQAKNFRKAYYTNEQIQLDLSVSNNEEEVAVASVEARLISPVKGAAKIRWLDSLSPGAEIEDLEQTLPSKDLSTIEPDSTSTLSLVISDTVAAIDHELEVAVTYTLHSDPESILRKVLALDIAVIRPFEANYDFTPKLTPEPWPSFFALPPAPNPSQPGIPQGLKQDFLVTANLVSFTTNPVNIEGILLTSTNVSGGAVCSSTTGVLKQPANAAPSAAGGKISTPISPEQSCSFNFSLRVQKLLLGDRDTTSLDLALEIDWRRQDSETVHTTILEVPRFIIPMAEPRVLLTASKAPSVRGATAAMDIYLLKYVIENPSMHFLTFNLGMESSEDFAFSGPKACTVSLVPVSKYEVRYRLLPTKRSAVGNATSNGREEGEWIRVQLNVTDAYFNQTLRVQPAFVDDGEERVKVDKKGGVVVLFD